MQPVRLSVRPPAPGEWGARPGAARGHGGGVRVLGGAAGARPLLLRTREAPPGVVAGREGPRRGPCGGPSVNPRDPPSPPRGPPRPPRGSTRSLLRRSGREKFGEESGRLPSPLPVSDLGIWGSWAVPLSHVGPRRPGAWAPAVRIEPDPRRPGQDSRVPAGCAPRSARPRLCGAPQRPGATSLGAQRCLSPSALGGVLGQGRVPLKGV